MDSTTLLSFCQQLPKVELHAHLNTSYSWECLQELMALSGDNSQRNLEELSIAWNQDIDNHFKLFTAIQKLVQTEAAVYKLTHRVIVEAAQDNVKYLELRSTPKEIPATGMTRELYLRTMVRAVRDCEEEGLDIVVRLLPSIDRRLGLEVAELTVQLADKLKTETGGLVIGIDLSGDPKVADAADFIPVLLDAQSRGLKLALHLAELPLYEETKSVLRSCAGRHDMRIGHGTYLHRYDRGVGHEEMEDIVVKENVPIETCITSNLRSITVESIDKHHFKYWLDKGHPVIICTDGKGVYGSTLSQEYFKAAQAFALSGNALKQYVVTTIDSIFENDEVKKQLRLKFQETLSTIT